ncbi:MAG: Protoheme farnesyltransferase [Planctomycetota bacterium]
MSSVMTAERTRTSLFAKWSDWVVLIKPRISVMVLITVAMASFVARWGQADPITLVHTLLGVVLVAASASAINQWLEVDVDLLMPRTADRPLPSGRLTPRQVMIFAIGTGILGHAYLFFFVNSMAAAWGFATWMIYGWIYTPLKRRSALNTAIGAISGATPILIGWSATGTALDLRALGLFLVLFLWQFPHFMAIAWMYREEYARAGIRMLTVVDPSGTQAGLHAVFAALALLPVSFIPALYVSPPGASLYVALAFLLGAAQLACAVLFFAVRSRNTARWLLRASLIYLPALVVLLMLLPWF